MTLQHQAFGSGYKPDGVLGMDTVISSVAWQIRTACRPLLQVTQWVPVHLQTDWQGAQVPSFGH